MLDELPLNASGKIDTKALPAPGAPAGEAFVAPRTPVEEVLAGIWSEVLRVEAVGVHDSFFELGGHSLLATRVVSRAREVFGVELPLRTLFEAPTVAGLAERVEGLRRQDAPRLPPMVPAERGERVPLSFAQERLWFLDRLQPGSTSYNMLAPLRLTGTLDAAALEHALGEVVRRHEVLRTVFAEVDEQPVQRIAPFAGFALPMEDLSSLPAGEREAAVRQRADQEASTPFDLQAGPLFRATLLRLAADEHVLLMGMHHIASDGWSMGVLYRELAALYAARRDGTESALPALPVQYADYAVWQRAHLQGEALDRQMAYWAGQLAGAPELLGLPTDRPRPAQPSYAGDGVPVELPREALERLQAIARAEGATLYMVLLAAFQVLLGRYAGTDDVVVGSAIAGRTRREIEPLIGFFVNTLVLRTDLGGAPTFREVLRRVRRTLLGAYENQDVPFEKLVEALQPERTMSHSPLFQVMFTLDGMEGAADADAGRLDELSFSTAADVAVTRAKFDLTLGLQSGPAGIRGGLEYATDLFDRATIERMVAHLARVVEQVSADPDVRLSALELMDAPERSRVLEAWNQTDTDYPADRGIPAVFAEQAAATPDAVALVHDGGTVTYAELNARANRLAHALRRKGVGPEVRVGIALERGEESIVAILAALKAGGAFVPLDPAYPADRIAFMLADSGAAVLVTQESLRGTVPADGTVPVLLVDRDADAIAAESVENPADGAGPRSLAYVMYTSGSTGTPKGVGVEQRSVLRLVRGANFARLDADQVMLQGAPVSFDASTLEIWGALLNGGRLVLVPGSAAPTLEELGGAIARHGVTIAWLTASLFEVMVQERLDDLRGLRQLLAGGDVLPAETVRAFVRAVPGCRLINGYGPTENTTFTACHTVPADWQGGAVPIGTPISRTRVYVLDAALRPVPAGVPGELYAGGDGVARGYLGYPSLTAERFVPDPFSAEPGARMYRTGDRMRWTLDGVLEFGGRLDAQVKVRGFRIEPGEVENALMAHADVQETRVIVREDVPGDPRLVAYVVGGADADELRAHLRHRLPDYMVPSAFVAMERLPLTANGKLDTKALPAPRAGGGDDYVAPRTPTEEVLAETWAAVLRVDRVGVEDSFFALGGHSLLAMRMVSRVREVFGVEVPLRALFEAPTVAALAARVDEMRRADVPALPPVVPVERTGPLPLSFAQERLWFLDRMLPGGTSYNMPQALRLSGALDAAALEHALGETVRRHEALRTTFGEAGGAPAQIVAPFAGFVLPTEDLSSLPADAREAEVRRRAAQDAGTPFDLAAGPLFRAALLRLAADEHVLLLNMHHIVSDGWSMGVLFREMEALYAARRDGTDPVLPALPVQYADFAVWQRAHLQGEALDRQMEYWKRQLAGAPEVLELPLDHPRPAVPSYRGESVEFALPAETLERLRALGRAEGATLYMVLLGAFQLLLGRYAGTDDVVVGSPIAGRMRREVEPLIGFFVNTLVLRTDLHGASTFRDVLRRVRQTNLGAYEHQDVPFEKLVAELRPERSLSHAPLLQVMFSMDGMEAAGDIGPGGFAGLSLSVPEAAASIAKFDLTLGLETGAGGIRGGLEYATDLFERPTIERMAAHFVTVLEQVAADADRPLAALELVSAEERARVAAWNATERPYPAGACIHELFEDWAGRTPDAVALEFGSDSLTYGELDERANRLAHHLRRLGVGPEVRVALCLERGPALIGAVLGILKAGGAYVGLDPAYPRERLAFMLADSAAPVLVTREALRGVLPPVEGLTVVSIDADQAQIAAESAEPLVAGTVPRSLAHVMYTSGSTGVPKGVAIEHGSVVRLVHHPSYAELGPDQVVLQAGPISFDSSTLEVWSALLTGGRLAILASAAPSLEEFGEVLRRHDVTLAWITSGVFQALVEERVEDLGGLRQLMTGGDVVPAWHVLRLRERFPHIRVVNGYGPTENTVFTCCYTVPEGWSGAAVPVGGPVSNTRVYVLDASLREVPLGVTGELFAAGDGLARGYLNRPALTAEKFLPDPFVPGARMYRTGDLARWLPSGLVDFRGRADGQVKIRGLRIETGEVESRLRELDGVRDCTVIVREDVPGNRRLVAYVVGDAQGEALRAELRRTLPDYMVPAAFVTIGALPLTTNGKVDRRALPVPEYDVARYVAPRTDVEEVLAEAWAEVLGVERVGVYDNFFDRGGHSLLIMKLVAQVEAAFGVDLPIRAVFDMPTLEAMAAEIDRLIYEDLLAMPDEEAEALHGVQSAGEG